MLVLIVYEDVFKLFVKIYIRDIIDIVTKISLRALIRIIQHDPIMSVNSYEFFLLPFLFIYFELDTDLVQSF